MGLHHRLSASGSPRWLRCVGSIPYIEFLKKEKRIPEQTTNAAAEKGTAVHSVVEYAVKNAIYPRALNRRQLKRISPKLYLEANDVAGAEMCYQYIKNIEKDYDELFAEKRYDLSFIYDIDIGGTADISAFSNRGNMLMLDYKNGRVPVEVYDNSQLNIYDLGVYYDQNEWYDFKNIKNIIVQPNAPHPEGRIRIHEFKLDRLLRWEEEKLIPAINLIAMESATLTPGPIQCEWCEARLHCEANTKQLGQLAQLDFANVAQPKPELPLPNTITREQLAFILDNKNRLIQFLKACEEYAEKVLLKGEAFGDYFLDDKIGNRIYIEERKLRRFIRKSKLTIKECTITPEPSIMGVTQLESYLKNKWDTKRAKEFMDEVTDRPKTGKRVTKSISTAEKDFSKLETRKVKKTRRVKHNRKNRNNRK